MSPRIDSRTVAAEGAARQQPEPLRPATWCTGCPHPPHLGPCMKRNGGTAYQCPCIRSTVPQRPEASHQPQVTNWCEACRSGGGTHTCEQRPEAARQQAVAWGWRCPFCGYFNLAVYAACGGCGAKRPEAARQQEGEGDMAVKRPWVRPEGCECDEKAPVRYRCTKSWMRCNARLTFEMKKARRKVWGKP